MMTVWMEKEGEFSNMVSIHTIMTTLYLHNPHSRIKKHTEEIRHKGIICFCIRGYENMLVLSSNPIKPERFLVSFNLMIHTWQLNMIRPFVALIDICQHTT